MNQYLSKIDSLLEIHAHLKSLTKKELKFLTKPWITQGLQNSVKKKNNIYSKFLKCKNQKHKEFYHSNYKTYRNLLSTLLKRAKGKYFTKFFNEDIENIKKKWIAIKSLVSMKRKGNDTPSNIRNDEKYIHGPIAIANTFNSFITSIAETVQAKIKFSNKSFRSFLSTKNNGSFRITATDKEEICKIISSVNINKSCGPNSIPTKILRLVQDQISKHLATLCNLSFSTAIFPTILKTAKVIPIHKRDSRLEVCNYRPVCLLSNIDKIFEKLMHSRLIGFLEERKILYYKQFGFRKDFSTNHVILNLPEIIQKALDDGKIACGVVINLEKAFDTVSRDILLEKLDHYGIREASQMTGSDPT